MLVCRGLLVIIQSPAILPTEFFYKMVLLRAATLSRDFTQTKKYKVTVTENHSSWALEIEKEVRE